MSKAFTCPVAELLAKFGGEVARVDISESTVGLCLSDGTSGGLYPVTIEMLRRPEIMEDICDILRLPTVRTLHVGNVESIELLSKILAIVTSHGDYREVFLRYIRECDSAVVCELLTRVINGNPRLNELTTPDVLGPYAPTKPTISGYDSLVSAIIKHRYLKSFQVLGTTLFPTPVAITILSGSRSIREFDHDHGAYVLSSEVIPRLKTIIQNNWVLRRVQLGIWRGEIDDRWVLWHTRVSEYAIALLPLAQLCSYEMLWIIDWTPPYLLCEWQGDPAYDPLHGKKVALIEGLVASYRKLRG
jgi:hypothetical protein